MGLLSCGSCKKKLRVRDELTGKKVKCPSCGAILAIPALVVPAAPGPHVPDDLPTTDPDSLPGSVLASAALVTQAPPSPVETTTSHAGVADGNAAIALHFLAPKQQANELGRLGKYRILRILGQGGMGVVFEGEDPKLMRAVAIKAMLPRHAASASAGQRFLREAQAMAKVEHDHIVRVYQVDEDGGVPFLAMEFLKGEALDVRLRRERIVPILEVLRIGREIAEGLSAAHGTELILPTARAPAAAVCNQAVWLRPTTASNARSDVEYAPCTTGNASTKWRSWNASAERGSTDFAGHGTTRQGHC